MALLGIIPYLLVAYLFVNERLQIGATVSLFSALVLFSILAGFSLMRRSAEHLVELCQKTGDIESGKASEPIEIKADQELIDIAHHFNSLLQKIGKTNRDMKELSIQVITYARDLSLSFERIKKEEQLRDRLSRYVGETLVEKLVNAGNGVLLENERREVTVLFVDIRSFTTLTERMPAKEVLSMLNQFFGVMIEIIFRNSGILDKFIGDQLMAVFGLIPYENSSAYHAIQAAIEMQHVTEELMKERAKQGKEIFEIGIGINTGSVIVGNVGSENRMDYTVIGDTINVAAGLEKMARGGEIIIGDQTYRQAQDHFCTQRRDTIYIKNRREPVVCYNVLR